MGILSVPVLPGFDLRYNGEALRSQVIDSAGQSHDAVFIHGLKRVSKPGLRIYAGCEDMPKVMNGLGIVIVSTSKGIMTDKKARLANVGGEVLAFVW